MIVALIEVRAAIAIMKLMIFDPVSPNWSRSTSAATVWLFATPSRPRLRT